MSRLSRLRLRNRSRAKDLSQRLRRALAEEADLDLLLQHVERFLDERADLELRVCYLSNKGLYGTPLAEPLTSKQLQAWLPYERRHAQSGAVTLTTEVVDDRLRQQLLQRQISAIVWLRYQDELIGFLFIQRQRPGDYRPSELRLLETIAGDIAIIVKHVLAVEEMRQLNVSLRQNIELTTKELRASNRKLQRLDQVKNEFISMASHQLRTPLTSIKGYLDMILQGDLGEISQAQRVVLKEAFLSSERMARLINDFLNVSRLQTGRFAIERRLSDLAMVLRQEIELLEVVAKQHGVVLQLEIDPTIAPVVIDADKVRQAVMNMIDNAIYYSPPGATVQIRLAQSATQLTFTVQDSGIGVPADEQAEVFDKFFRGTNARKRRPDGTGVGLFLARKVVLAHGGQMIFQSTEGQGSLFGFSLPLAVISEQADNPQNDQADQTDDDETSTHQTK